MRWAFVLGILLAGTGLGTLSAQQPVSCPADAGPATNQDAVTDAHTLKPRQVICDFHLHTDSRGVLTLVLGAYGIHATLDDSVVSRPLSFNMDHLRFEDASTFLKLATGTFFTTISPDEVRVIADTPENRTHYERQYEEEIAIPGLNAAEHADMLAIAKNLFSTNHAMSQDSQGRITLRAPQPDLTAMNQVFQELFDGHSELLLDVQICEVDRTNDRNSGLTLPNQTTAFNLDTEIASVLSNNSSLIEEIIASGLASADDTTAILAILVAAGALDDTVFANSFAILGNGITETGVETNTMGADMLLNTSEVKTLTRGQIRVTDHEEGKFFTGEHYPVMTASYSALASVYESSSVTVPQVSYQDIGLMLKVKPNIESNREVGLNLNLEISSLAGSSINDIPVLNHRQFEGNVNVHFGNSALITSAISRQDAKTISGSGFPTSREDNKTDIDLVVTVTPHLLRYAHPDVASQMWLLPVH